MEIRHATIDDLPAILAIQNWAIRETSTNWRETELELAERTSWFENTTAAGYPIVVADDDGQVLGFATYHRFDLVEGEHYTVENSIYVAPGAHGRGIGSLLMDALIAHARASGTVHAVIAVISADNPASIKLHEKVGFENRGTLPEVGRKFGQWLDASIYQLTLPLEP